MYLIWVIRDIQNFFTHMETSTLLVKGFNFTYTRQSRSLKSSDSLACHTYRATERSVIWPSSWTRNTHSWCRAFCSGAVTIPVSTTLVCRDRDSNTYPSACKANVPTNCTTNLTNKSNKGLHGYRSQVLAYDKSNKKIKCIKLSCFGICIFDRFLKNIFALLDDLIMIESHGLTEKRFNMIFVI